MHDALDTGNPLRIDERADSCDGSTKLRLLTRDNRPIEAVLMRFERGGGGDASRSRLPPRYTACLSSQSGCALSCTFCATGRMGLGRSLTAEEIVGQVGALRAICDAPIDNIVMMGMGEPLHNYDEVLAALGSLARARPAIAPRRMTISTVGWVPGIERLACDPLPVRLALSLHAPNDDIRSQLMPVNRRFPIDRLLSACDDYCDATGRGIFVEYLLLEGINDGVARADELAELLLARRDGLRRYHVNVIAYNPIGTSLVGASDVDARAFRDTLRARGLQSSYRVSRGRDIAAACGQLAAATNGRDPDEA